MPSRAMTLFSAVGVGALMLVGPAAALDAHGPDAWQVTGVAPNDVLNVRMGPGTQYPIIGAFAPNARGLQQVTCVPLVSLEQFMDMSEAEYAALPPRWCLMTDVAGQTRGWVSAAFLAEDGSTPLPAPPANAGPAPAPGDDAAFAGGDDAVAVAEMLVRRLYEEHDRAMRGAGPSPLVPPHAAGFFSTEVLRTLAGEPLGADPLYSAQDTDIRDLRIARDPNEPMFRGLITVHADFFNFGAPRRATYALRADPGQPGAPVRIIRIAHDDGWTIE